MSLLRCFLAIELPLALQDAIHAATEPVRRQLGTDLVRWVNPRNVHLSLKFLGDTAPSGIGPIEAALNAEVPQYDAFDVQVGGFGAFPNSRKPRVIWIGLSAPAALASLQHELDVATTRLGYSSEERGFSPHLTVGRVRQNLSGSGMLHIREVLEQTSIGQLGCLTVEAVHLFKSDLEPTGSVYTKLHSALLTKT